jgi:hypothetical protein
MRNSTIARRLCTIACAAVMFVLAGCVRASAPKAHTRTLKPAPASVKSDSSSRRAPGTAEPTPRVDELMAARAEQAGKSPARPVRIRLPNPDAETS